MPTTDPDALIASMSITEKIGQCVVVGWSGTTVTEDLRDAIRRHACGGVRLSPFTRLFRYFSDARVKDEVKRHGRAREKRRVQGQPPWVSPEDYTQTLATLRELSLTSGAGIPVHFVLDQEGDTSKDLSRGGMPQFPSALGLAAAGDPAFTYEVARTLATLLADGGISVVHSPVLDVNVNPLNPEIGRRSFGDDPERVAEHGIAVMRGFRDAGVLPVAKHFPGRGNSAVDAHHQCPVLESSADQIRNIDLLPYRRLIDAGLQAIMLAHCIYPAFDDKIATVSPRIVTGLLREELGFEGLITTDSMTMGALIDHYGVGEASVLALIAGADILLMKAENVWRTSTFEAIHRAVEEGRLSEEALEAKVRRILDWKIESGLMSAPTINSESAASSFTLSSVRSVEREAAGRAVVVPKGAALLPTDTTKRTALVYQENSVKTPNDTWDYPSLLGDIMEAAWPEIETFEVPFGGDEFSDDALAFLTRGEFEQVIVTNYYDRSAAPPTLARRILALDSGFTKILITNTVYTVRETGGLLPDADAVIVNLNLTPEGLRVTRDLLVGRVQARGRWPLSEYDPFHLLGEQCNEQE